MSSELHIEMAKALRAAGWVVHKPPDLMVAGPWEFESRVGSSKRLWEGGNSMATYAGPECPRVPPRKSPKTYHWTARLFGARKGSGREGGYAKSLEAAKADADEALLRLLIDARKVRLCCTEKPEPAGVSEDLYLPVGWEE
jgi:hypothetical protein